MTAYICTVHVVRILLCTVRAGCGNVGVQSIWLRRAVGRKVTSKGMCAVFLKVHHSVHGVLQYTLYVCRCVYNMRDNTSV